ncbi:MAG: hypothetical protein ABJC12_10885 [Saprospiraceae bacterium]
MAQRNESYPAKLLLFGEYSVLSGSQALAVPLKQYHGSWTKQNEHTKSSLLPFVDWLEERNIIHKELSARIISDLENGLIFQSTIPQGYGIGSSGALVAAMYDRYFEEPDSIDHIQAEMAAMETYFHGTSSGMDPLISYTQKAVYKNETGQYRLVDDPGWPTGFKIYLLDSGVGRETEPLVKLYKHKSLEPEFNDKIQKYFIPVVEHAIHFYLSGENKMLGECLNMISQFQRKYFSEMIPDHIKKIWDEFSMKDGVYMKLCGAGGGGYFMIIAADGHEELRILGLVIV